MTQGEKYSVTLAVETLVEACYGASLNRGWWEDSAGVPLQMNPLIVPVKLMLIVSEVGEAMEAHRKGLADEHLLHHDGITVELADAIIRICDLAGALQLPLGQALAEKMEFNAMRADHDPANRAKAGGKAY